MPQRPNVIGIDRALIGTTLAERYEIRELMACGGMGRLYLAVQQPLGRTVVVKVMTPPQCPSSDSTALQARFFREAATCARLRHPNTVTLFDYGELKLPEQDKTVFMVMEYIEGRTLSEELQAEGKLTPERALRIATQITRSLREAHGLGVVHRDLKPSNIMLIDGPDGEQVKVLDFGIAKVLSELDEDAAEELTRKGDIVGSPSYMSPEQITNGNIDGRADIYSLGTMLFHLIAGQRPYSGRSATLRMMAHLHRPVPSIRSVAGADIHPAVDALIQRCMAKEPADRFVDVDALLLALSAARGQLGSSVTIPSTMLHERPDETTLHSLDDLSGPVSTLVQTRPLEPRTSVFAGIAAGVMVLCLLAGVARTWWPSPVAVPEPVAVSRSVDPAPVPQPELAEPAAVEVVLTSTPVGAQVHEGAELLGETPLSLQVPAADAMARALTVSEPGYASRTVQLHPGDTVLEPVSLERHSRQPGPAQPRSVVNQDILLER